jgi:hypothetical protein
MSDEELRRDHRPDHALARIGSREPYVVVAAPCACGCGGTYLGQINGWTMDMSHAGT